MENLKNIIKMDLERKEWKDSCFLSFCNFSSFEKLKNEKDEFLHSNELKYFETLKFEKRQKSYLLGRYTAKMAIVGFMKGLNPAEFEIAQGVFGQPLIKSSQGNYPEVTISHTEFIAASLAFPMGHPMGLDVESISTKKNEVLVSQSTSNERNFMAGFESINEISALHLLWALKESLSKVIKTGLTVPIELYEADKIELKNPNCIQVLFKNFHQFRGVAWNFENFVLAITLPKKTEISFDPEAFSILNKFSI